MSSFGGSKRRRELQRPNLKEAVAARLREFIFSGVLPPGIRIDQDGLADELGVSKLPLREALIALENEGLVESLPRRGAYVAQLTRRDITDHYTIYGLIAGLAAKRAAAALTEEQLNRLDSLHRAMEQSTSPVEQEELNFEFHRIINRTGGSRRLRSVLSTLNRGIPSGFFEYMPDWPNRAHVHHKAILEALHRRDGAAARQATEETLRDLARHALRLLEHRGYWSEVNGRGDDDSTVTGSPAGRQDGRQ